MAFARALGEYGSVVFISGNMPMRTEISSLLIIAKLEQYDYTGATSIAIVMLVASFLMLLFINLAAVVVQPPPGKGDSVIWRCRHAPWPALAAAIRAGCARC